MKICNRCKNIKKPVAREYECLNDNSEIHLCAECAVQHELFVNGMDQPPVIDEPDAKAKQAGKKEKPAPK